MAVWRVFRGLGTVEEKSGEDLDYWMRRTVPAAYALAIGVVYSIELPDNYRGLTDTSSNSVMSMHEGMFPWIIHAGKLLIAPAVIAAIVAAFQLMKLKQWAQARPADPEPVEA